MITAEVVWVVKCTDTVLSCMPEETVHSGAAECILVVSDASWNALEVGSIDVEVMWCMSSLDSAVPGMSEETVGWHAASRMSGAEAEAGAGAEEPVVAEWV